MVRQIAVAGQNICETGQELSGRLQDLPECRLEKGLLQYRYMLESAGAFESEPYEHPYQAEMMRPASVLDVRDEQVKGV